MTSTMTSDSHDPGCDQLRLVGLEAIGHHGVLESERLAGQPFRVDVTLGADTRTAAGTDRLADTVDYAALATAVTGVVEGEPVNLIEVLAQRIADVCLTDRRVQWAEVTVHKPAAPLQVRFQDVTVTICRSR